MRNEYSTLDIVKALGIPRERLRSWMNEGFIKPSKPAEGKGTKAIFTRADVYSVELFSNLLPLGFKREVAASLIDFYKTAIHEGTITYIMFRSYYSSSGKVWEPIPLIPSDSKVLFLKTATFKGQDPHQVRRINPHWGKLEDWNDLYIRHLGSLRKSVDDKLSALE